MDWDSGVFAFIERRCFLMSLRPAATDEHGAHRSAAASSGAAALLCALWCERLVVRVWTEKLVSVLTLCRVILGKAVHLGGEVRCQISIVR